MHLPLLPQPFDLAPAAKPVELAATLHTAVKPRQKRRPAHQTKPASAQYTWEVGALYLY